MPGMMNPGEQIWGLKKVNPGRADDSWIILNLRDCNKPPTHKLCTTPPEEKWKGYPVRKRGLLGQPNTPSFELLAGHVLVHAWSTMNEATKAPYLSDADLEGFLDTLGLDAIAKAQATPSAPPPGAVADTANMKTESAPAGAKCPPDTAVDEACIKLPPGWVPRDDKPRKPGGRAYFKPSSGGSTTEVILAFWAGKTALEREMKNLEKGLTDGNRVYTATGPTPDGKGKFYVNKDRAGTIHLVNSVVQGKEHVVVCEASAKELAPAELDVCKSITVQ
jgi:hypothetical protein